MAALGHPQVMALSHLQAPQLSGVAVHLCHATAYELVVAQRTFSRNRAALLRWVCPPPAAACPLGAKKATGRGVAPAHPSPLHTSLYTRVLARQPASNGALSSAQR